MAFLSVASFCRLLSGWCTESLSLVIKWQCLFHMHKPTPQHFVERTLYLLYCEEC